MPHEPFIPSRLLLIFCKLFPFEKAHESGLPGRGENDNGWHSVFIPDTQGPFCIETPSIVSSRTCARLPDRRPPAEKPPGFCGSTHQPAPAGSQRQGSYGSRTNSSSFSKRCLSLQCTFWDGPSNHLLGEPLSPPLVLALGKHMLLKSFCLW